VNVLLLATLGSYMAYATFVHWREGPEADETDSHLHRGMPLPVMPVLLFFVCQVLGTPSLVAWLLAPRTLLIGACFFLWLLLRQVQKKAQDGEEMGLAARFFYVLGGMLQTALLGLSCYVAYENGVLGRSLFTPGWVILGAVAGHGVFGVSLCFSHRSLDSLKSIVCYLADIRPLARFAAKAPQQLFACVDVSLMEELIYRVAVQGAIIALLGNPVLAIGIVAVVFSVVHRHFFYNHVVDSIEFLVFSVLLGALYYWTGSLMLVVMIHTVRNFEIVYFDHAESPLPTGGVTESCVKA
jgi:membrane protease YdiL (CAAX protease family)